MEHIHHALKFKYDLCIGCSHCTSVCPTCAIHVEDGHPILDANRCIDCGYENAEKDLKECPHCHGHHIDTLQRITGYLVGTTDRWNSGKLAELHDRVIHK